MATPLATIYLPQYDLRFKCQFSNPTHFPFRLTSLPQRCRSGFALSLAIRTPKLDSNPQKFDDDDDDFGNGKYIIRRRRRRKGDGSPKQWRWWSDEYEVEQESSEVEVGILQQIVDNLLIFQVFKSYGWFSPIIIFSLLVASGLKAFLLAFSIPFGVSLVIFAFQKLQEWQVGSPNRQYRYKRRAKFGRRMKSFTDEEDDQEETPQNKRNKERDYQSQIVQNNGSFNKGDSGSGVNVNSFGGWG